MAGACAVAFGAAAADPEAPPPAPAAGGGRLLAAAEAAPLVALGTLRAPRGIDLHGWRAALEIERVLSGSADAARAPLTIAWEELSSSRPPRFAEGTRVLLALEPLPAGSLWTQRFPKRDALAVVDRGEAFLRDPSAAAVGGLAAWLALSPAERDQPAGLAALARLAVTAEPAVAGAALRRLAGVPALAVRIAGPPAETLSSLLADSARGDELRRQVLAIAGERQLVALEPGVSKLAARPSPLQADAVDALARMRRGLSAEDARRWLASGDASVRAAVVRHGGAGVSDETLRALIARDPAPLARGAALETLAARRGTEALPLLVAGLQDPEPLVRGAATRSVAALGAAAVPAMSEAIWAPGAGTPGISSVVLALALCGSDGAAELERIAAGHPDERVRKLALFTLGRLKEQH